MDDDISFDGIIARRQMRQRQAEIGRRALAIVDVALRELEQKIARGEPLNMTCADALKLRDVGRELLERSASEPDGDDASIPSPKLN